MAKTTLQTCHIALVTMIVTNHSSMLCSVGMVTTVGYPVARPQTTHWVSPSNDVVAHILQHRIQQLLATFQRIVGSHHSRNGESCLHRTCNMLGSVWLREIQTHKKETTPPLQHAKIADLQLDQCQSKKNLFEWANDPQHGGQEMLSNKFGRF